MLGHPRPKMFGVLQLISVFIHLFIRGYVKVSSGRKIFHSLISPSEVLKVINRYMELKPSGSEIIELVSALGRILAEDVYASWDSPPFDRSEVDGYATTVRSLVGAEEDNPVKLRIKGYVKIGEVPTLEVSDGEAAEIDTGAMIPRGADSVVMIEYTRKEGEHVSVYRAAAPGENIARAGSDILKGELILRKGTLLTSAEVAALAATGIREVKVFKQPKVGIISIGSELTEPGEPLSGARIFDINSYSLAAAVTELGSVPKIYGVVKDDEGAIKEALLKALKDSDLVLTSGGTSAGIGDLTYRVLNALGKPGVIVHGLKQKPGKPTVIAIVKGKIIVGLPGFPLSCLMAFRNVVAPILAKLEGLRTTYLRPWKVTAKLARKVNGVPGKEYLVPVVLVKAGEFINAYPLKVKSGSVYPLTYADGFIRIPGNTGIIEAGNVVEVELFTKAWSPPDLVVMGSHDYLLENLVLKSMGELNAKLVPVGSTNGLLSAASGLADIGGTHLLDAETLEYNKPILNRLGIDREVYLIRGWCREIGLIVKEGNPKNISGFEDLLRSDVVFINRNKGSGTRTLIDLMLREVAKKKNLSLAEVTGKVRGYLNEVKTHTGVAAAVKQGRADVGVAVKYAAVLHGLKFIKISDEVYDLAIHRNSINKPAVKELIELLRRPEFNEIISYFPGYRRCPETGEVIHEPDKP